MDNRVDLSKESNRSEETLIHLKGYYGDGGENEGVLSVITVLSPGDAFPEMGRVIVGSPLSSPLLPGYIPGLGMFSCSPDAADRLADELKAAAAAARAAIARPR